MLLNQLNKSRPLRIVNLLGLSVIFAGLLLSYSYIRKELSYDRFNKKAERIIRFSLCYGEEPVDGRNYGFSQDNSLLNDVPGIEEVVLLAKINTGVLTSQGKPVVVNDFYFGSSNFFRVFDYRLVEGEADKVLDAPEKVVISERFARQLFGDESPLGKEIRLEGRKFEDKTLFVSGVFENFPENSHFHTDLIAHRPNTEAYDWPYVYLLLNEHTDLNNLIRDITGKLTELDKDREQKTAPYLIPLTDIHLHSRVLREMEPNGNIYYIYLVAGANILLLIIVLFNLWLNAGLIFASNRKYYQLLRLNGASSSTVLTDESALALVLGVASIVLGGGIAFYASLQLRISLSDITPYEIAITGLLFAGLVWFVSILPVITGMTSTLFSNTGNDIQALHFSLSKIRYLLVAQFSIVMFIVIVAFGIGKQMILIKTTQVGGKEPAILVLDEQPLIVQERYDVLKAELLKHSEIEDVTAVMQLPGSAVRDGIFVIREGESETERKRLPLLVAGNGFLSFFHIPLLAGNGFQPNLRSYKEEWKLMLAALNGQAPAGNLTEEYVINRSAMKTLGFQSPEEAIGKHLSFGDGNNSVGYISGGTIAGVTDDFTYTTLYEESIPLIILQRNIFLHCLFVRLSPDNTQQALSAFNRVWEEVNPDYPANYSFLQDVYSRVYRNERNTESLVWLFSLLSLLIANLGLIIVMAYIIKRKTKEIGIRRIHGASFRTIIRMLNSELIIQIGIAFLIAVPAAWYVISRWLENFARKTTINGWIFILAGLFVLLLSVAAVSWQSWRAATMNPAKTLKSE